MRETGVLWKGTGNDRWLFWTMGMMRKSQSNFIELEV